VTATSTEVELGRGKNLSLLGVIAQSLGFIGPVFGAAFLLPSVAGLNNSENGAGVVAPLALLVATIGLGGVAWVASRYAKKYHHAGAIYEYVNQGWGRRAGFVAGWVYYGGTIVLSVALAPVFGGFLGGTIKARLGWDIHWLVISLIGIALVYGLVFFGVEISMKVQLFITGISMLIIALWAIFVVLKGGPAGNSIDAINPGQTTFKGLAFGLVYACLAFTGWETAGNLAEETADPGRSVPRAMLGSLAVVGLFFTVTMYALVSASGFDFETFTTLFPNLLTATGSPEIGSPFFSKLVEWVVMIDVFAVSLGVATATTRGLYAMARDGHLPRTLAKVHAGRKTPVNATILVAALALIVVLWTKLDDGIVSPILGEDGAPADAEWLRIFAFLAALGGLLLVLVYFAVAALGFRNHEADNNQGSMMLAGVLGCAATLAAVFGTLYQAPDHNALDRVWLVALIWIVLGVGALAYHVSKGRFSRSS
jgi:amino acid transporter